MILYIYIYIYIGSSVGESWLLLSLASDSGNNIGGSMSLIGGKVRSNIWRGVNISLDSSTPIASGSIAMLSADAGSSDVGEALRLNSWV